MSEMSTPTPYCEDPEHVPDPTSISGTLETTNTGGGQHDHLTGVTRIFHHAEAVVHHLVEEIAEHHDKDGDDPEAANPLEVHQDPAETVPAPEAPAAPKGPQKSAKTPSAGK